MSKTRAIAELEEFGITEMDSRIRFVGEPAGRFTAESSFYELLDSEWSEIARAVIPQWQGFLDRMILYKRTAPRVV